MAFSRHLAPIQEGVRILIEENAFAAPVELSRVSCSAAALLKENTQLRQHVHEVVEQAEVGAHKIVFANWRASECFCRERRRIGSHKSGGEMKDMRPVNHCEAVGLPDILSRP